MALFKKDKEQKEKEPAYYVSGTGLQTINYRVYYLGRTEKLLYGALAFVVGAAVGYLFYGGIGKDAYGNPTTITWVLNILIPLIVGIFAVKFYLPIRTEQLIEARRKKLNRQFRDMLDGITTVLGAGSNVPNAFETVYHDLKTQYSSDAFIIKELEVILAGMQNGEQIEDLLYSFGKRSGISSIESFAAVFQVSYRKGGNVREAMSGTHEVISQKMEIMEEIETTVTAGKFDSTIMTLMPIGLVLIIKLMSPDFAANFVSGVGLFSTTIAVICFVVAYFVSKSILNIKI